MVEEIKSFFAFLFDKKHHVSSRAGATILLVVVLFSLDNIMGFTYHYDLERRIDHVKEISTILESTSISKSTREQLEGLQEEALARSNIVNQGLLFWNKLSFTNQQTQSINNDFTGVTVRNDFIHLLTSSGLYLLISLILLPIIIGVLFTRFTVNTFIRILLTILSLLGIIFFHYHITGLLPDMMLGSWKWNYVANVIIQLIFIVLFAFAYTRVEMYGGYASPEVTQEKQIISRVEAEVETESDHIV